MSLAVTVKLIKLAKLKSLKECLETEYQLSQNMVYREDFNNGVDSVLIRKNYQPCWNPTNIKKINTKELNKMFEPHVERLYL